MIFILSFLFGNYNYHSNNGTPNKIFVKLHTKNYLQLIQYEKTWLTNNSRICLIGYVSQQFPAKDQIIKSGHNLKILGINLAELYLPKY